MIEPEYRTGDLVKPLEHVVISNLNTSLDVDSIIDPPTLEDL